MSILWSCAEAIAATGGECSSEWAASGVSIDTRSLVAGDLFVALQDVRDGHDFVAAALEKGAVAALVSRIPEGLEDAPLLVVPDVLKGLEDMARAARSRAAKLIAVTGSVGKTGTKEMLRTALAPQGHVHAAEKSYNNHWGVPLTLARMPRGTDFAVIEMGMNHPGEIAPLSKLAEPDVAIITNVAAVHMEAFADVAEIAVEKAAVVAGLVAGGTVILNADVETFDVLDNATNGMPKLRFGEDKSAGFRFLAAEIRGGTTAVNATANGKPLSFTIGGMGKHLAMNALATLAAVDAIGADVVQAAAALVNWHPPSGRGEQWQVGRMILIDDSYNANPLSVGVALEVLAAGTGHKTAILGDMLELGLDEHALHAEIADNPAFANIDVVHCIGPRMKFLHDALPDAKRGMWVATSADLVPHLGALLAKTDVVMVKGSLGAKMGLIVDAAKELGDARLLNVTGGA